MTNLSSSVPLTGFDFGENISIPEPPENAEEGYQAPQTFIFGEENLSKSQLRTEQLRIAREQAVAERKSNTLRTLYSPTAKALNPDAETDPVLRAEKREALKAVEEAYAAKDVAALLAFEKQWLGGRKGSATSLTLKEITDLVEILLDQTQTLEMKKWELNENSR